ncbi:2-hydroxyacyl-CoA dehydratase [Thermodesulfobacteriota bacterium]
MYSELLELCGFEQEEIRKEQSRVKEAFHILGIEQEDVDTGKKRIETFFDVDLQGIRKTLGLWIKELIDMVLARQEGKKIVYTSFPPVSEISAALALASEEIYCCAPEIVLSNTLNLIFNKINPVLEAAESHGLAPGIAFCSYLQTRLGAIVKGIIPKPDLLIPSSYMCDLTPETDQILHEGYHIPVSYIDNIMDVKGDDWPNIDPRKVKYLAHEMKNAVEKFTQLFGCKIPESDIRQAIHMRDKLAQPTNEIMMLTQADPVPLGQNNFSIVGLLAASCIRRALTEGVEVMELLRQELDERVRAGKGVLLKGAPRVLLTMAPHDPTFIALIESLGLAITGTAGAPTPSSSGPSAYTSFWDRIAEGLMKKRGGQYSSWGYILQLKELADLWDVDGLIFWTHYSCRQYSIFPLKAKEIIEKELNIPVILLEGDYCDFRVHNTETMKTRLETFAEVLFSSKEGV